MTKGFIQSQGLINKMNGRQRMQIIFFQVLEIAGAGLHGEDVGKIMMQILKTLMNLLTIMDLKILLDRI